MTAALALLANPLARTALIALLAAGGGVWLGWDVRDRICDAATARAIIAKQRIDLDAAKQKEADDAATIGNLTDIDKANQEKIRDLANRPNACLADDAVARGLRDLR